MRLCGSRTVDPLKDSCSEEIATGEKLDPVCRKLDKSCSPRPEQHYLSASSLAGLQFAWAVDPQCGEFHHLDPGNKCHDPVEDIFLEQNRTRDENVYARTSSFPREAPGAPEPCPAIDCADVFFPCAAPAIEVDAAPAVALLLAPWCIEPGNSSLGTMSIKKSNWSDFERAFAMSARESVRRLLESATMKARAVISAMKTRGRRLIRC